jgi:hypothetical protein
MDEFEQLLAQKRMTPLMKKYNALLARIVKGAHFIEQNPGNQRARKRYDGLCEELEKLKRAIP